MDKNKKPQNLVEKHWHDFVDRISRGESEAIALRPGHDLSSVKKIISENLPFLKRKRHDLSIESIPCSPKRAKSENLENVIDLSSDGNYGANFDVADSRNSNVLTCFQELFHQEEKSDFQSSNMSEKTLPGELDNADSDFEDDTDSWRNDADLDMSSEEEMELANEFKLLTQFEVEPNTSLPVASSLFKDRNASPALRTESPEISAEKDIEIEELAEATYNGNVFCSGECYSGVEESSATYGIVKFYHFIKTRKLLVECVEIVSIDQTFLFRFPNNNLEEFKTAIGSYVRLKKTFKIPISVLGEKSLLLKSVPDIIYEEQPSPLHFAFYKTVQSSFKIKTKATFIELFAGAGGAHLGFKNAGFEAVVSVEKDPFAVQTLCWNNDQAHAFPASVEMFLKKCRQDAAYRCLFGDIVHVHASPPCQGFSRANRNGGKNDEQNNELSQTFVEAVRIFRPFTATFENVPGMLMRKHRCHLQKIVSSLLLLGYQVRCVVLNASDYGDPQNRKRLIIFAAQDGCHLPKQPNKTHGILENNLLPTVTVEDAIGFLTESLHQNEMPAIFNHNVKQRVSTNSDVYGDNQNPSLLPDQPALTIRASSPPLHYNGQRLISVREAATLQSFPVTYTFFGSCKSQYQQVGNAVPVKLATAIARSVREALHFIR